jgi:hypothetical protein
VEHIVRILKAAKPVTKLINIPLQVQAMVMYPLVDTSIKTLQSHYLKRTLPSY